MGEPWGGPDICEECIIEGYENKSGPGEIREDLIEYMGDRVLLCDWHADLYRKDKKELEDREKDLN